MQPTALKELLQGAIDDQLGHLRNIAKLQQIGGHLEIPIVLSDFLKQIFNARTSAEPGVCGCEQYSRNPTYNGGSHPSYG